MGWIQDGYFGEASNVSAGIGYFVICLEMAAVSIWHHKIFGHEMYKVGTTPTNFVNGMRDVLLAKDVINDMRTVLQKHKKGTNPVHVRAAGAEQLGQLKRDPEIPEMEEQPQQPQQQSYGPQMSGISTNGPIPLDTETDRPLSTTSRHAGREPVTKEGREDAKLMGWRSKETPTAAAQFSIGDSDDDEDDNNNNLSNTAHSDDEDAAGAGQADLGARVQPIDFKNVRI